MKLLLALLCLAGCAHRASALAERSGPGWWATETKPGIWIVLHTNEQAKAEAKDNLCPAHRFVCGERRIGTLTEIQRTPMGPPKGKRR